MSKLLMAYKNMESFIKTPQVVSNGDCDEDDFDYADGNCDNDDDDTILMTHRGFLCAVLIWTERTPFEYLNPLNLPS